MKKFIFLLASLFLSVSFANTATTNRKDYSTNIYNNGYGNVFIFTENNIEFSVFPDGQFDFYIPNYGPNVNVSINSPNLNISFNSGYNYTPYVQYDEFGAIIQIENTPVFYDYYGRISQVGNINIYYNNFGRILRVGNLYVHYNRYNQFSHSTGFINIYNKHYVYKPWHNHYRVPARKYCVVYNKPYRQHYTPIRYQYRRPFYNNYRPNTSVATRRGQAINKNRDYATVNRNVKNRTIANNYNSGRRLNYQTKSQRNNNNLRKNNNTTRINNNNQSSTASRYHKTIKKPILNNTRIYTNKSVTSNSRQNKPVVTKRVITNSRQTNSRVTQSRNSSRSNNIKSSNSRRL